MSPRPAPEGDVLAWLITWTTYGTWLHGDRRGSQRRTPGGIHVLGRNDNHLELERAQLRFPPFWLDARMRAVVRGAIVDDSTRRGWHVFAINVRTNHVHVVAAATANPVTIRSAMKASATRALWAGGLSERGRPTWTRLGNCRALWSEQERERAIRYVVYGQTRRGHD